MTKKLDEQAMCDVLARTLPQEFFRRNFRVVRVREDDGSVMLLCAFSPTAPRVIEYSWVTSWDTRLQGTILFPHDPPEDEFELVREIVTRSIRLSKMEKPNGEVPLN